MIPRYLLLPTAGLLLFGACTTEGSAPMKPDASVDAAALKATIQDREKEYTAAYVARDARGIANLYSEEGVQLQGAASDDHRGRDGITQAMQAQFDTITAVASREDITEEVIPAGDYAFEVGRYSLVQTTKSNQSVSQGGRYVGLWHKDADGVWRLMRDMGMDVSPKTP